MILATSGILSQKIAASVGTLLQTVNVFFRIDPQSIGGWNLWTESSQPSLLNTVGGATEMALQNIQGQFHEDSPAGSAPGDTDFTDQVLQILCYNYSNESSKIMRLVGLNTSYKYSFLFATYLASTDDENFSNAILTVQGISKNVDVTHGQILYKTSFTGISPDSSGYITIEISKQAGENYPGINGLIIKEYN